MSDPTPAPDHAAARMFPIMPSRNSKPHPMSVPWSVAEKAYSKYALQNGHSQSLEKLAGRGGFYADEMDELFPEWQAETSEITALRAEVDALRRESIRIGHRFEDRGSKIERLRQTLATAQHDKLAAEAALDELRRENEHLKTYARHERSLGAEGPIIELNSERQAHADTKAEAGALANELDDENEARVAAEASFATAKAYALHLEGMYRAAEAALATALEQAAKEVSRGPMWDRKTGRITTPAERIRALFRPAATEAGDVNTLAKS